jgi:hypothetical protein
MDPAPDLAPDPSSLIRALMPIMKANTVRIFALFFKEFNP